MYLRLIVLVVSDLRCNVSTVSLYTLFALLVPRVDAINIFCFC